MKKILFFAATAMLFAACTNDELVSQSEKKAVAEQAVGFDVYIPAATASRAGQVGTMTTDRIQRSQKYGGGFGVYAFKTEDTDATGADVTYTSAAPNVPNFMVNEKMLWDQESMGWYYSPIKYWPNETDNDSQTDQATMDGTNKHTDRLTFFAYAPYVTETDASGTGTGIVRVSDAAGKLNSVGVTDPSVSYKAVLTNPNNGVDLLWGVAPAGGMNYTAVNGNFISADEGLPLLNMIKPNVNTNMKFLFQHALARFNIKAVAAVDQLSAGGVLDPNTRITINKITLTGYFGETGDLNLNNTTPNVARWVKLNDVALTSGMAIGAFTKKTITITANATGEGVYNGIAEHLRYIAPHDVPVAQTDRVGVTTVLQNVLEPIAYSEQTPWVSYKTYNSGEYFAYSETTPYYMDDECSSKATAAVVAPTGANKIYTISDQGVITQVATPTSVQYPNVNIWYIGEMHKIDASDVSAKTYDNYQAYTWDDPDNSTSVTDGDTFTPKKEGVVPEENDYVIIGKKLEKAEIRYTSAAANTKYYKRDASYYMVVPTYNACVLNPALDEQLRTVTVEIEYYITTEDSRLNGGITQTKNVVKKNVIFPSIQNGKSYNLNMILGLTSVKFEAEVDDWKVVNVNGYLPQNTAE